MRLAWALLVMWCMVASATPHGPRDRVRHIGVTVAPAYHHPVRKREHRSSQLPFVVPARVEWVAARSVEIITIPVERVHLVVGSSVVAIARGPPVG